VAKARGKSRPIDPKAENAARGRLVPERSERERAVSDPAVYDARGPPRLIFKAELLRLVGVAYSSIFSWMRAGKFPLAREIGPGGRATKIAWLESEVMAWLASRPQRKIKPST